MKFRLPNYNAGSPRIAVAALAVVLAVAGSAAYRGRQDRGRRVRGEVGAFDSYVLSLSWAPEFCAEGGSNRSFRECDLRRHIGFIVHGLWPQRTGGQPLEYCRSVHPVSEAVVDDMLSIMPDRSLVQHEWRAHGSCTGLTARDYFAQVKRAYSKIRVPRQFQDRSRQISTGPHKVEELFQTSAGLENSGAVRVACHQGELTEVRICLSRNLDAIACSSEVRDCPASILSVRPIP